MTTEQMQAMKDQLDALATLIQQNSNDIESKRQDEISIEDEMQTIRYAEMQNVMTARFEINQKLQYTNDDQRKAALKIALDGNADYQSLKSARSVKIVERVLLESELQFNRDRFRALELQTLFHANAPAA